MKRKRIKYLIKNIFVSFPLFFILIFYILLLVLALEVGFGISLIIYFLIILIFRKHWILILCLTILLLLAFKQYFLKAHQDELLKTWHNQEVLIRGNINNYPVIKNGQIRSVLLIHQLNDFKVPHPFQLDMASYQDDLKINYLTEVICTGEIKTIEPWQREFYLSNSFLGSVICKDIEVINGKGNTGIIFSLVKTRSDLYQEIHNILKHPYGDLFIGIILGDDADYSTHLNKDMQNSGTSHIIAVSGYNVNLLISMIFIFSRRIKRKYLSLISSLLLLLYLFFVGWDNIPAKRAVIMQMYLIGGWLGGQKANILYGISLAALFLCVENIYVYRSLSFQLSFIATIGIIVLKDSIINFLTRISKNEFINDVIAINFAAGISTMPLIWLYFNKISLISLIVNLIIAPLIPLVFLLGLIFIFLLLFQIKFIFINYGLFWILNLIVELIDWSGSLSSAVIDLKANPLIFLFVFFIFLFLIFWTFYNKYKDV